MKNNSDRYPFADLLNRDERQVAAAAHGLLWAGIIMFFLLLVFS